MASANRGWTSHLTASGVIIRCWCHWPKPVPLLRILNRSGNRPSHDPGAAVCDEVVLLLRTAGFRNILLRGDTVYSQTEHLVRWDQGTS